MQKSKSALMKWLARSLIRLIPMGESAVDFTTDVLPTLSQDVYGWWSGETTTQERREELESLASADPIEVQSAIEAALEDAATGTGNEPAVPIDPARREKVKKYLEQVPDAIRRSMRRPDDASGRTVPPHLAPRTKDELAALLPQRPPKFSAGDRPIAGVDIELVSPLGVGGFGEVWRAHKTHLGQDVALKFCLDQEASASLRNETALLRRLMTGDAMHPGIVRLMATYNDCAILEYEFVKGGDLAGVIREWHAEGKRPKATLVIDTIRQIAEIVAFAHQLDPPLVHRDLKPANILVQRKPDGSLRFRLTDFGIGGIAAAKQVAATQRGNATTSASTSLHGSYSFLYASPQQMRADRPRPDHDDVYSLGVIFWQLANGDLSDGAPGGTTWADELKAEGYPANAVALLASCFDRRPERRPKTAAVFAEALKPASDPPKQTETHKAPPKLPPATDAERRAAEVSIIRTDLRAALASSPIDQGRTRAIIDRLRTLVPNDPEASAALSKMQTHLGPGHQNPKASINWWILGSGIGAALLSMCLVSSCIVYFAGQGAKESAPAFDFSEPTSPTDPRLRGMPTDEGDVFVTTVNTPTGEGFVVENDGEHYLLRADQSRVPVIFNQATGMWQDAN